MSESERVRLARVARDAALAVPGVQDTEGGPVGVIGTPADGERIIGVTCTPVVDGGYDVALRLVCQLAPLPALAEEVRAAVARSAASAGVPISQLTVHVVDLVA